MAPSTAVICFILVTVICLLQVSTAFHLFKAIEIKAREVVAIAELTCRTYEAYCDVKAHVFAHVLDADGVDVSSIVCKIAVGAVLGC